MGQTLIYSCEKCGNSYCLNYGIGFTWCNYEKGLFYPPKKHSLELNFYNELPKRIVKEAQEFIEKAEDINVNTAYYYPYICKKCGKIASKLYFEVTRLPDGKTYIPTYKCRCHGEYKKIYHNKKHFYCHECGAKMKLQTEVMWD